MKYLRVEFTIFGDSSGIAGDDNVDPLTRITKCLNESGLLWVHDYYWPGDNYYCFIKVNDLSDLERINVENLGRDFKQPYDIEVINTSFVTHRKRMISEEFEIKYQL